MIGLVPAHPAPADWRQRQMTGHVPTRRSLATKGRLARRLAVATALAALGASALATSGFGQLAGEPITANRFVITIDGYEIASFQELSGITSEVDAPESLDGDHVSIEKLAGKFKPPTVTLKRGLTNSMALASWYETVRAGTMAEARKSATLTAFNAEGRPVAKWWLEKAWPKKLEVAGLKAGATQALTETVVLTADYIQRAAP
jgi:phage tail-like protein